MLFAVPTMYHRLLDAAASDATVTRVLQRLRLRVSGSAALPAPTHQRLIELGCPVYERYGLTETLINCAVPASGAAQPGRVGPPLPGVELRLVDDTRRPIDARDDETVGEVAVRGPSVFHGYLGLPEATDEVRDADGWLYTGDLATLDGNGSVRIHGRRATDLIKTGGFRVGAGEIEACLLERPEVREVAVIGLPDSDLGERIVAYVVGEGDPAVLCDHVAARLTPHKRPREVRFVSALPRNAMGKIEKRRLRDAGA